MHVQHGRACHGKMLYLDEILKEVQVVYLDQIDNRKNDFSSYFYQETAPKNARYLVLQFWASIF